MKTFSELRLINVSDKIEKKNNMSYLSWTYAVDTLLQEDPTATWEFLPNLEINETILVRCQVHAFGKTMFMQLAVFDFKNQAIKNPNACQVSNSMMRCLVKCIATFGIGLYIYAGEDLPDDSDNNSTITGDISKWIIPIGVNKGLTLEAVGYDKLLSAINYFMDQEKKTGKKIDGLALEYLTNAQNYINDLDSNEFNQTKFK